MYWHAFLLVITTRAKNNKAFLSSDDSEFETKR
jgi:hypothetical protein